MRSKRALLASVGAVVVILIVVLVWTLTSAGNESEEDTTAAEPSASASTAGASDGSPSAEPSAPARPPKAARTKPVARERPLTDPVPLAGGASASVTKIEKLRSEARLPGEVSAPALRFTIEVTAVSRPLDLSPVVVNAYYGKDRIPAITTGEPGGTPLTGRLKAGDSTRGVYVFNVPPSARARVYLEFAWSPDVEPVILAGKVL